MITKGIKNKLSNLSLSNEYLIFSLLILSTLLILSIFSYCYTYSFYVNDKNEKLKNIAGNLQHEIEIAMDSENKKRGNSETLSELKMKHINEYANKISQINGTSFFLMDNQCNIISKSFVDEEKLKLSFCGKTEMESIKGSSGFLSEDLMVESMGYSYFTKMKNHPYIVFTGSNKQLLEQEIHRQVFPILYGFIFTGLFCIIVLFFFRKKIIGPIAELSNWTTLISTGKTNFKVPKQTSTEMFNLAKALVFVKHYIRKKENHRKKVELANEMVKTSTEAKENFIKSINRAFTHPLKEILVYTEILSNQITNNIYSEDQKNNAIKCIEKIREAAINIKFKTSNSLDLSYFDFNDLIKESVQINLQSGIQKEIEINMQLEENIPAMYGDALKLKQIFVNLISQSIENSPEREQINIFSRVFLKEDTTHIEIIIKDNSFGLSEEELKRMESALGWREDPLFEFESIESKFIEKLIKMHQGNFYTENKIHEGRTVFLVFPLLKEEDFVANEHKNNVFQLRTQ